ncbi:unnamed protein product [Cyclocybe aegerita]|uniref:Uncharacterized protein n=1 Tax=Cyclocybe aegerita TaxID=1973307 RepID=A0A8S0WIA4_CYCAE|nr:unnamed protein product [Cyclocybe aegerita]
MDQAPPTLQGSTNYILRRGNQILRRRPGFAGCLTWTDSDTVNENHGPPAGPNKEVKMLKAFLLFLVSTAIARSYLWEGDTGCRPTRSVEPKCANASATNHSFSCSSNSDLPPGSFIVVGVNSTWEFLNYIGCPGVSVKRLLLSDSLDQDIVKSFGDYRQTANYSDLYEVEMVRHHNRLLDIKWEYAYRDYSVVIKSILEHVAPTLEALSWDQYNPRSFSNLGIDEYGFEEYPQWRFAHSPLYRTKFKFPLLTELTIRSPDGVHYANRPAEAILSSGWALPSLTHLHLASYIPYDVLHRFVTWKIPSNITHIRLTGDRVLHESAPWTQVEKDVWDRYPGPWEKVMRLFRGIPKLTIRAPELQPNITIIVQPGFPPTQDLDDHFRHSTEFLDSKERCYLPRYDRQLNKTLSHPRVHVKLPEKAAWERYGPSSGVYSLAEAIEDFSSRSRGEDAEWLVPDQVTGEHPERFWW